MHEEGLKIDLRSDSREEFRTKSGGVDAADASTWGANRGVSTDIVSMGWPHIDDQHDHRHVS